MIFSADFALGLGELCGPGSSKCRQIREFYELGSRGFDTVQLRQVHPKSGFAGTVTWLQRAHRNRCPSALPIMALKLFPSTQYGQRTMSLIK